MIINASIEARMKSTRLPGKVLSKVCGKTILEHIYDRASQINSVNSVFVATSKDKEDDDIVKLCVDKNMKYFRGSESDVLDRITKAHEFFKTDVVLQLTGDSPFVDPNTAQKAIDCYLGSNVDYVSNTLERTYPVGIRYQIYSLQFLRKINNLDLSKRDREFVTTHICRNENDEYLLKNMKAPNDFKFPQMRLTLDYPEDLKVVNIVYNNLYKKNKFFTLAEVIKFMNENQEVANINKNCKQIYKEGA